MRASRPKPGGCGDARGPSLSRVSWRCLPARARAPGTQPAAASLQVSPGLSSLSRSLQTSRPPCQSLQTALLHSPAASALCLPEPVLPARLPPVKAWRHLDWRRSSQQQGSESGRGRLLCFQSRPGGAAANSKAGKNQRFRWPTARPSNQRQESEIRRFGPPSSDPSRDPSRDPCRDSDLTATFPQGLSGLLPRVGPPAWREAGKPPRDAGPSGKPVRDFPASLPSLHPRASVARCESGRRQQT